jgi:hypothetical protein
MLLSLGCVSAPKPMGFKETVRAWGLQGAFPAHMELRGAIDSSGDGQLKVESLAAKAEGGRVLRIQKVSGATAGQSDAFVRRKAFQLRSIYEPQRDPYFAALSKDTVCPERFRLERRKTSRSDREIYALFANERLTYGACNEEDASYRVFVALLKCPGNQFMVESFIPAKAASDEDAKALDSISCLGQ